MTPRVLKSLLPLALLVLGACARGSVGAADGPSAAPLTLKDAYRDAFVIGAALNPAQFNGQDTAGVRLITTQFNTITPENHLKWVNVHPRPGVYNFEPADAFVAFGERHDMKIIGHTLVWHSQVPQWVFRDSAGALVSRDTLLARMKDHIFTVVGRYKGRIHGWDVVNEALNEDGTNRNSLWRQIIGDDFIIKAFEYAHEADPDAELYYNDYSVENAAKRAGAVRIAREIQAAGVRIDGVGLQGHNNLIWPTAAQQDSTIVAFKDLGLKVMITELDVEVLPRGGPAGGADVSQRGQLAAGMNPYVDGLPDSIQTKLAARYAELFAVYLKHADVVDRVTFWGVRDGDSWLNGWPIPGRTNYPLVFDRAGVPKPAFDSIMRLAPPRPRER